MADDRRTERRHGLRARLLAGTVLVAMCSIGATAWLSVQSTTGTIQAEQGQSRASVANIYDGVLAYAATHPSWDGVAPVLADLSRRTGLRIGLTTGNRVPIAGAFGPDDPPLSAKPAAVADPLAVDVTLDPRVPDDRIDARAVGPFRLVPEERADVREMAETAAKCMRAKGLDAAVVETASGRSFVRTPAEPDRDCDRAGVAEHAPVSKLTTAEDQSLLILNSYLASCFKDKAVAPYEVRLTTSGGFVATDPRADQQIFFECLSLGRKLLLAPYVTPAALLFVSAPAVVGLPAAGTLRIVIAAAIVLVLTVGISMVLAGPVLRPLRVVTAATQRMRAGDRSARAEVRARWEVAELAAAFNQMSEHLARVERQRTDLVNDVSHELRTPLGNIRGWLVAAQDGVADLDPELVESLLEETLVLQHVVDDLQDLAAADAGELRLRPEPVDAGELLAQIAAAADHTVTIAVETSGDLRISADPVRLRQVVGNLVTNAVRHTPPSGRITLRACRAGDEVVIEVSDTGSGIAPEDLPHVFNRFWRADRSRSRATGGRGLGLAIARQLVAAHGGTISVTSTLGAGTTFRLSLPETMKKPE